MKSAASPFVGAKGEFDGDAVLRVKKDLNLLRIGVFVLTVLPASQTLVLRAIPFWYGGNVVRMGALRCWY